MREPGADVRGVQLAGVALLVEENEVAGPGDVSLLGANAVVARAQREAELVEELGHDGEGLRR